MPLIRSDIFTAFRDAGIADEHAMRLAEVLTPPPPGRVDVPAYALPWSSGWLLGVLIALLAGCLLLFGYVVCEQEHAREQAARTRALIERSQQPSQP